MANFDGTSANETFTGGNGNETINGAGGDDTLGGGGGTDVVDGGSGAGDRLVMAGPQSAYAVTLVDGTHTRLVNAGTGEDVTFTNTEFVQFSDVLRTALEVRNITSNAAPAFSPSPAGVYFSGQAGAFDGGGRVLLQPDGKILVVGSIANGQASPSTAVPFAEDLMVTRFNADGTLDATFGGDGRVTTSAFGTHAQATDAVLQADGKLVVTALVWKSGSFFEFGVARYNTDGSLDTSFDGDGTLIDALDIRSDQSRAVLLQPDGKIVVGGFSQTSPPPPSGSTFRDFALVRYNPDGTRDATFNGDGDGDGKIVTSFGGTSDQIQSMVLMPDGKFLVFGTVKDNVGDTVNEVVLARYNSDGSVDTSFGAVGSVSTAIHSGSSTGAARSMLVQADGKIVVLGFEDRGLGDGTTNIFLLRYNADGTTDATFNGDGDPDGKVSTPMGNFLDIAYKVVEQADGKLLVSGLSFYDPGRNHGVLLRYNTDGSLDTSFGNGGAVYSPFATPADDGFQDVAVQADGKILVTGFRGVSVAENYDTVVARYNADGTLDTTFNAQNTLDGAPAYIENGSAVVLDGNVSIYDEELSANGSYAGSTLTLARDGGPDAQDLFGAGGTLAFSAGNVMVGAAVIGTVSQGGGSLTLNFNGNATQELVDSALRQITYANASDAPSASVQVDWTFNDGSGAGNAVVVGSTTVAVTGVNDPLTGGVSIYGYATEGQTLNAGTALTDADGLGTLHFSWLRNGTPIAGSPDAANYQLVAADVGATISVQVGYTDLQGTAEGVTSAPTWTVLPLGTSGNDTINGTAGNDLLIGNGGDDQLLGNGGDDDLNGNNGNDSLDGGAGIDWAHYGDAGSGVNVNLATGSATGGGGTDTLTGIENAGGSNYNDTITGDGGNNNLQGMEGDDLLRGGGGSDFIGGGLGNDWISGGAGWDSTAYWDASAGVNVNMATGLVTGGGGSDTLVGIEDVTGSPFDDTMVGTAGSDNLNGGPGNDLVDGGAGSDWSNYWYVSYAGIQVNLATGVVIGGGGNDTLIAIENIGGSPFDDTLVGDSSDNTFNGAGGNDWIQGAGGFDAAGYWDATSGVNANLATGSVTGGAGNDTLMGIERLAGSPFDDTLVGDGADNNFTPGTGNDSIDGAGGQDDVGYWDAIAGVNVNLATGVVTGGSGNDTLTGIERVGGSSFDDTLVGSDADNNFNPGLGDDSIDGAGGSDWAFFGDAIGAVVADLATGVASGGAGNDTLTSIENLGGSSFADSLTGSASNNALRGGAGNDTIQGGDGNDFLTGESGDDSLVGGNGNADTADYFYADTNAGVNVNLVTGLATGGGGSDTLVGIENVTGSVFNDTITGDGNANGLNGQDGDDTLLGGDGSDFLTGGMGDDSIDGGNGGGDLANYAGASNGAVNANLVTGSATGGAGNDTLTSIENVTGGSFDDTLTGDGWANVLDGREGGDLLAGGAGNDTLLGGSGDDSIQGNEGGDFIRGNAGNDTIDGGLVLDRINYTDGNSLSYSDAGGGINLDLSGVTGNGSTGSGTVQDGYGGTDTVSNVQFITGSASDDSIHGSSSLTFEQFEGGAGNDTIDGGAFIDPLNGLDSNRAIYNNAGAAVTVDLDAGTATGGAGNDTLVNINQARGSAFGDTLLGSNRTDYSELFEGRAGNDTIDGRGGFDTVRFDSATTGVVVDLVAGTASDGLGGTDSLVGIEGAQGGLYNDILTGGNAANGVVLSDGLSEVFRGGAGNDTIDGGQGYDRVDFTSSTAGVDVTLNDAAAGSASDGLGGTDELHNIEGIRGSDFNDTLTGSDSAPFESFEGRIGNDSIDGKGGFDRADYQTSTSGINVNLDTGFASDGWGGTDTLAGIEWVRGTRNFNDTIAGSANADRLEGQGGSDSLDGAAGNDTLDAGTGVDTVDGSADNDLLVMHGAFAGYTIVRTTDTETTMVNAGTGENVTFRNIEQVQFTDATKTIAEVWAAATTAFNLVLVGDGLNNTLTGGTGNDSLSGLAGNDTLIGSSGNDSLTGGAGNDSIDGGAGTDWAFYGDGSATTAVQANLTTGFVTGGAGSDTLAGIENIGGSAFNDSLTGNADNNVLRGEGGNDTLVGNDGNDYLTGGAFNDNLQGGNGIDTADYFFSDTSAAINANLATGVVTGGGGKDTLSGIENVNGSNFNDTITGDANANVLEGRDGNDLLTGAAGNDTLLGGGGSDSILGNQGGDFIRGGAGNDTIDGGVVTDRANYTDGNSLSYSDSGAGINLNLSGITGNGSTGTGTVQDGLGGTDTVSNVQFITGSAFNDTILGSSAATFEQFDAGPGDDTINGGALTDTLNQFDANRANFVSATSAVNVDLAGTATGGAGNDVLVNITQVRGSNYGDTLTGTDRTDYTEQFDGRAGNDTIDGMGGFDILRYDSFATSGVVVDLVGGTANDGLGGTDTFTHIEGVFGSVFDDVLNGGNPANGTSVDGPGQEIFRGGAGNDTIDGGQGYDRADYTSSTGGANVTLGGTADGGALDGLGGTDVLRSIEAVRGSDFNDTLTGSDTGGFESFDGRGGNDIIDGKGGVDRADYNNSAVGVTVNLTTGSAAVDGWGGTDTLLNVENVRGSRDAGDSITGSAGNNQLEGQGGNDTMDGAGGSDTLYGGAGNDVLAGGLGQDFMEGGAGNDSLQGGANSDAMQGGAGNDTIDGGAVTDRTNYTDGNTLSYEDGTGGIVMNLAGITGDGNTGFGTVLDGMGGTDTVMNVPFIVGSQHDDSITGSSALMFEMFEGLGGNDTLDGGAITDLVNGLNSNRVSYQSAESAVTVDLMDGTATGGAGNDLLSNFNQVRGSSYDDTLLGSDHEDYTEMFEGRAGNDSIDGRGGFDMVRYDYASSGVTVNLATGAVTGGAGNDTISHIEGIQGSAYNDSLTGGNADNGTVLGDGKIEVFRGGAGNDTIDGGQGYDRVDYTSSTAGANVTLRDSLADSLDGTAADGLGGTDVLVGIEAVRGSDWNDTLAGSDGAVFQSFEGRAGNDAIDGKGGVDRVEYGTSTTGVTVNLTLGTAAVDGWGGSDTLLNIEWVRGSQSNDAITGNAADNKLEGMAGNDNLAGGAGNDTLDAGTGVDTVDGGADFDTLLVKGAFGTYGVQRTLTDTVLTSVATGESITFRGIEQVSFNGDVHSLSEVLGNSLSPFDDSYVGTPGDDSIDGQAGNDTLSGIGGDDTLIGGAGADSMIGGAGNDLYVADVAGDQAIEVDGEGTDSVSIAFTAAGTYTLGANVENATVTGALAVSIVGNASDNALTGNAAGNTLDGGAGNDTLDGAAGNDTLIGGAGDDTLDGGIGNDSLIGGAGDDTYVVNVLTDIVNETLAGGGTDTVNVSLAAAGTYVLGVGVDNAFVGNSTVGVNLTGTLLANLLTGNGLNNTLSGLAGNDTLAGGGGTDILDGGLDTDQVNLSGNFADYQVTRPVAADTVLTNLLTGEIVTVRNVEVFMFADGPKNQGEVWGNALSPFDDVYTGTPGNDLINGLAGSDMLTGLAGDDTIIGGLGIDTMVGGEGNDTYTVDVAGDQAIEAEGEGSDSVNVAFTVAGPYNLGADIENATVTSAGTLAVGIVGNALDNLLTGNAGANNLQGAAGNDTLNGGLGNDILIGGTGDDLYIVNVATDQVNETLGGGGTDTVNMAFTAAGTYVMTAGVENALIVSTVTGTNVTGSVDANAITGNGLNNTLIGGAGNDTLAGGGGTDILDGGLDADQVNLSGNFADYLITRPNATDTVLTRPGETVTIRNVEVVLFGDGERTMNGIWGNTPSAFNDVILGTAGDDAINGLAGNDSLSGLDGNDTLTGGLGIDTLAGGLGNDVFVVEVAGDQIVEGADEGTDTVNATFTATGTYTLGANVEIGNVTAAGTLAVGLVGNALDNLLTGNAGANNLQGAAGNDTLNGGLGSDILIGGIGDDTYVINVVTDQVNETLGGGGTDTVNVSFLAAATYVLTANVENGFIGTATTGVNLTGNLLGNTLTGNGANNTLNGMAGNDTLEGGGGTDIVDGGADDDTLVLDGLATDYVITRPIATQTVFTKSGTQVTVSNVENVQFDDGTVLLSSLITQIGSVGNDPLTGSSGDDTVDGGAGNDTLSGLGGDDTLLGGAGNDRLLGGDGVDVLDGGDGSDTYVYAGGEGDDLIVQNDTLAGSIDTLEITVPGLTADNVAFTRGYHTFDDLVVSITQGSGDDAVVDQVVVIGFFRDDGINPGGAIDQVRLTQGTGSTLDDVVFTQAQIAALALIPGDGDHVYVGYGSADTLTGNTPDDWMMAGGGNDTVTGSSGNDTIFGGSGNDTLAGGSDNDLLAGGAGNDTLAGDSGDDSLTGGAGSDTYQFGLDGGQDVISEKLFALDDAQLQSGIGPIYVVGDGDAPLGSDTDTLAFQAGVLEADVRATRSGNDLKLTIVSTDDSVTVRDYFANGVTTIERIQFASGASWTATSVRTKVLAPTSGDDEITGYLSGDRLNGLAGDDTLDGREGNDTLNGGAGDDTLTGGTGSDRFVLDVAPGEGNTDTITDFQGGVDTIALKASLFSALGSAGTRVGLGDNLTYDSGTGELAYDADGVGGAEGVTIAILGTGAHPGALGTDFLLVA